MSSAFALIFLLLDSSPAFAQAPETPAPVVEDAEGPVAQPEDEAPPFAAEPMSGQGEATPASSNLPPEPIAEQAPPPYLEDVPAPDDEDEDEDEDEEATKDADQKDADKKKKKKKKLDNLRFSPGARVMGGWEIQDRRPRDQQTGGEGIEHSFFLQQARVKLDLEYKKRFDIVASIELADALKKPNADRVPFMRNAYGDVRFHRAARLRFGYFKRPFSRIELTGPSKLPFRGRGLSNGRIIEDRGYGDRSIGGMLWGKVRPGRIEYGVGAFAPGLRQEGVDVVGRVESQPVDWLSVGANAALKRTKNGQGDKLFAPGAGADFQFALEGFTLVGEVIAGKDYLVPGVPWSIGVVSYASYDFVLPKDLVLQPVVLGEWADINLEVSQNDSVRAVAGLNLIWKKRFRVMPQAEFIRPSGTTGNIWVEKDTYYLMLTLKI